jgi:transcriptional regulator with XRE-family HTH domain
METYAELGLLIREARLDKGMSLGQLASAVGRSSSSVRRWERGEVAPAASVLPKLVAVLDIDPQSLRHEEDPSETDPDGDLPMPSEGGERVSTVEQPIVNGAEPQVASAEASAEPLSTPDGGILANVWDVITRGGQGWKGWARGFVTFGVLIGMLLVFIWAMGELVDALGAILDSFDVGSTGEEN